MSTCDNSKCIAPNDNDNDSRDWRHSAMCNRSFLYGTRKSCKRRKVGEGTTVKNDVCKCSFKMTVKNLSETSTATA